MTRLPRSLGGHPIRGVLSVAAGITLVIGLGRLLPRSTVISVPASIASDCSHPVNTQINRFLASVRDGHTVRFARNGCYRLADSLWLRDRKNMVVDGNGATFAFDTTTNLTQNYRSNWRILRGTTITLKNMTVRGACRPQQCGNRPPPAKNGYLQYGINLESTAHPTIDHVHVHDVLSDGVSAEGTLDPSCCWRGVPTSDLVIRNSQIDHVGRQLIGITDLDRGVIEHNVLESGPEVGIDIEVDVAGFMGRNIRIANNTFNDVHANIISNGGLGAYPEVSNLTIVGNTMATRSGACSGGIYLRAPGPMPPSYRSGFVVEGNTFKLIGPMVYAERIRGLTIQSNSTRYKDVGCSAVGAVELVDAHSVLLAANDFAGYRGAVYGDAASGGIKNFP